MKKYSQALMIIGMIGLILVSINAIRDSTAEDMVSAVIVQLMFASFFISGYIGFILSCKERE